MCKVYADVFADCLRRGEVPYRDGAHGQMLPTRITTASSPRAMWTRSCSGSFLSRLQHWASQHGSISGTQNAFRPRCNCEQHVTNLYEVISSRSHAGRTTWGLFVGLKKAYDSVNQDALWRVAETAGISANFARVLRNWNTVRTATLDIKGERTAPAPSPRASHRETYSLSGSLPSSLSLCCERSSKLRASGAWRRLSGASKSLCTQTTLCC
jgi:hypothetical protein